MKKRLPPSTSNPRTLIGPQVTGYTVGSWCPTPDGTGPATAVAFSLETSMGDIVVRLKTPEAVDNVIQMLLRHKRDVWPDSK